MLHIKLNNEKKDIAGAHFLSIVIADRNGRLARSNRKG